MSAECPGKSKLKDWIFIKGTHNKTPWTELIPTMRPVLTSGGEG
jgi:hypothetical protein